MHILLAFQAPKLITDFGRWLLEIDRVQAIERDKVIHVVFTHSEIMSSSITSSSRNFAISSGTGTFSQGRL